MSAILYVFQLCVVLVSVSGQNSVSSEPSSTATKVPLSTTTDISQTSPSSPPEDCTNNICVRKCCPLNEVFSLAPPSFGCTERFANESEFNVDFRYKDGRSRNPSKPVLLLYGFPSAISNCSDGTIAKHRTPLLLGDGQLYTSYDDTKLHSNKRYCMEHFRRMGTPSGPETILCYSEYEETIRESIRYYSHSICLIISNTSLVIIIALYVFLPKLRDLAGLCLLSHACSLFTGNCALLTGTLFRSLPTGVCTAVGIIMHTSFIATYLWLTVMCFDIWRYVRLSIKGIPSHAMNWRGGRLFAVYSCVVWGIVSVISTTTMTLHFLPKDALPKYVIRPFFGANRCFIIDEDANMLVYYFGILGFISFVNLFLVTGTIYYLYRGGAKLLCFNNKKSNSESSVFNANHLDQFWYRFQVFGLTIFVWSTEVLSWKIPPKWLWEVTDIVNTLQGFLILTIFMRQQKKRDMVRVLLCRWLGRAQEAVSNIVSDETSTTMMDFTSLEGSDKETVERIRKLSKMEETAASTIARSISVNKIEDAIYLEDNPQSAHVKNVQNV